jgi:Amt family ammonium transporter
MLEIRRPSTVAFAVRAAHDELAAGRIQFVIGEKMMMSGLEVSRRPLSWVVLAITLAALLLVAGQSSKVYAQAETAETEAAADAPVEETAATESEETTEEPPAAATPEQDYYYTINTLIMFLSGVLVIFMQAGFALVEVGLNQSKNAVNISFKNLMDFCIGALLFLFVGYGLMYPGADYAGKWFGFAGSGIMGLGFDAADAAKVNANPDAGGAKWAPTADFIFQVAFAATAATIVSGAVAGRLKFSAYLLYSAYISAIVYPISGMWKWGGGIAAAQGFQDFAGSIVVHAVGGFAGLAGAILLGPRIGRYVNGKPMALPGHNLTFATLGVFILLIGWYGFNPGSQLTYASAAESNTTCYIAVTTTLAACAGAISSMLFAWGRFGKPDLTMALNGMLAGLVGITANCNQVSLLNSIVIGAIAGVLVVLAIVLLDKLEIDDPVGAFPVHGICGLWGGIATGIFGEVFPEVDGTVLTRGAYILVQVKWSLIIAAWSFANMFLLFGGLKALGMLRVSPAEETEGLDIGEHGLHAYYA